jgi:L-ascorbate metabolism protein UlaG (beta-lactamase superfamily)
VLACESVAHAGDTGRSPGDFARKVHVDGDIIFVATGGIEVNRAFDEDGADA